MTHLKCFVYLQDSNMIIKVQNHISNDTPIAAIINTLLCEWGKGQLATSVNLLSSEVSILLLWIVKVSTVSTVFFSIFEDTPLRA